MDQIITQDVGVKLSDNNILELTVDGAKRSYTVDAAHVKLVEMLQEPGRYSLELYNEYPESELWNTDGEPLRRPPISPQAMELAQQLQQQHTLPSLSLANRIERVCSYLIEDAVLGYLDPVNHHFDMSDITPYKTWEAYMQEAEYPETIPCSVDEALVNCDIYYTDWDSLTTNDPIIESILEAMEARPEVAYVRFDQEDGHFRTGLHPQYIRNFGEARNMGQQQVPLDSLPESPKEVLPHSAPRQLSDWPHSALTCTSSTSGRRRWPTLWSGRRWSSSARMNISLDFRPMRSTTKLSHILPHLSTWRKRQKTWSWTATWS